MRRMTEHLLPVVALAALGACAGKHVLGLQAAAR
jgi:hypothetical protein